MKPGSRRLEAGNGGSAGSRTAGTWRRCEPQMPPGRHSTAGSQICAAEKKSREDRLPGVCYWARTDPRCRAGKRPPGSMTGRDGVEAMEATMPIRIAVVEGDTLTRLSAWRCWRHAGSACAGSSASAPSCWTARYLRSSPLACRFLRAPEQYGAIVTELTARSE